MKKIFLLCCVTSIILSGCNLGTNNSQTSGNAQTGTFNGITKDMVNFLISEYSPSGDKPKNIEKIENLAFMMSGFTGSWNAKITVPQYDPALCTGNLRFLSTEGGKYYSVEDNLIKELPAKNLKPGAVIEMSGNYKGPGFGFGFSQYDIKQINNRGWLMFKPENVGTNIRRYYYQTNDWVYDNINPEEWIHLFAQIGGEDQDFKRYPYNTMFISSDLQLHIWFKLFEQQLKYYEETTARKTIKNLSDAQFAHFAKLSNETKDQKLQPYYDLLAVYWALPKAILVDTGTITQAISQGAAGQDGGMGDMTLYDLSDEQLKQLIEKNSEEIKKQLPERTQSRFVDTLDAILQATEGQADDILLSGYIPTGSGFDIKQNYGMFKPRSHYTTNSLLKTYFMAVKSLSRHKFYNQIDDLAIASAIATKSLGTTTDFDKYNQTITTLIGDSDDIETNDIKKLIEDNKVTTDEQIVGNAKLLAGIKALRKQKIISTTYVGTGIGTVSEDEVRSKTEGMLVLGEKFTIDARVFDQVTAGPTETEYPQKGSRTTALMIPAIVENDHLAQGLIDNWYKLTNSDDSQYLTQRLSHFISNKDKLNKQANEFVGTSSYYLWLKSLGSVLGPIGWYLDNDSLHQMRKLNTYLGSYTELKHATLLYTKQAMAELGGGGQGDCDVYIDPPAQPVPRGYIEPNKKLNDSLIAMTLQLQNILGPNPKLDTVLEYYKFTGKIIDAQLKNQTIKDEDFERLRLYDEKLGQALVPDREIGAIMDKEMRASIIADIFTSGEYGPLYVAVGRPYLMVVAIDDRNGRRFVVGPVYSTYEFDEPLSPISGSTRLTDEDWQSIMGESASGLPGISGEAEFSIKTLPMKALEMNR